MRAELKPIESEVVFPVPTTEPRLAAILDKVTLALGDHMKRRIQFGRAATDDGSLAFAVWIPGESFTGVLVSLEEGGTRARLRERAVSSQADQVLHAALGLHLSSLDGSRLSVSGRGPVKSDQYERALEEEWNDRWLLLVKTARGATEDLTAGVVDGDVVLRKDQLAALPQDEVKAFQSLYEAIDAEVKRRNI
jgi:hypothetical protein